LEYRYRENGVVEKREREARHMLEHKRKYRKQRREKM